MVLPPGSGIELNPPPPCSASIVINTGTPSPVKTGNLSHKFVAAKDAPGHVSIASDRAARWKNADITVSYCVWGDGIVASMNVQVRMNHFLNQAGRGRRDYRRLRERCSNEKDALLSYTGRTGSICGFPQRLLCTRLSHSLSFPLPSLFTRTQPVAPNPADPRAAFCLAVSPPAPGKLPNWPRSVVFLLDRSGSMTGEPIASATAAIKAGLDMLNDLDQFNIIAFDHEQISFDQGLVLATQDIKARAHQWVAAACTARGLTVRRQSPAIPGAPSCCRALYSAPPSQFPSTPRA